jgi:hypothetical protein
MAARSLRTFLWERRWRSKNRDGPAERFGPDDLCGLLKPPSLFLLEALPQVWCKFDMWWRRVYVPLECSKEVVSSLSAYGTSWLVVVFLY